MRYVIAALAIVVALIVGIKIGADPDVPVVGEVRSWIVGDGVQGKAKSKAVDLDDVRKLIERDYYKKVPDPNVVNGSVEGMVKSLKDPFSHYFSPADNAKFKQLISGSYSGVGMAVDSDERGLVVLKVYDDTPAARASVRAGDVVTAVDGVKTKGKSADVVVARIKGKPGTKVELTVQRPKRSGGDALGAPRDVKLTRQPINLPVAASEVKRVGNKQIGHIELISFTETSAHAVREEVAKLRAGCPRGEGGQGQSRKPCVDGIVLDLRGNGGGRLDQAVGVSSIFVDKGVVVATDGRARPREEFDATGNPLVPDLPVVVLVDEGSASASEIVAGALKYMKRAKIVGTRTFGKGTFQEVTELDNGGALSLTLGQYFVAGKVPIGKDGLKPDVKAKDRAATRRVDEALKRAYDVVAGEIR